MGQSALAFIATTFQGQTAPGRLDPQLALWETARHGKYYAATYGVPAIVSPAKVAVAGAVFRGANTAAGGVVLSAALATTYTGLCLSNPAASGVNLAVKRVSGVTIGAPAGELAFGLITGWLAAGITVHTTPLDTGIVNGYVGAATSAGSVLGPASVAHLDAACTLVGTPQWDRWFAANVASTNNVSFAVDLDDDLIIPPGGYAAVGANVASSTFLGSFMWEQLAQ